MKSIRPLASAAAVVVLLMCIYSFLLGNKVFDGKFENEAISWYILAKGIFCAVALIALARIVDLMIERMSGGSR
jgi:hypothetical protein